MRIGATKRNTSEQPPRAMWPFAAILSAMSRGNYSAGKRQREAEKARKKREKAERRARKREEGPGDVPLTTAEEVVGSMPSVDEAMEHIREHGTVNTTGAAQTPCRLFVGSLSWDANENDLRQAFGEYGEVTDAFIVNDRDTGRSRGFGFVTMASRKDAMKAIEGLNDTEIQGRRIVVNVAVEK